MKQFLAAVIFMVFLMATLGGAAGGACRISIPGLLHEIECLIHAH